MKLPPTSAFLALLPSVLALGHSPTATLIGGHGDFQLARNGVHGQILLSANDWWGVIRAAQDLAGDVGKVTGTNLTLGNWRAGGKNTHISPSPANGDHVDAETHGGETTVLYTYNPTTNYINVSSKLYHHNPIPRHKTHKLNSILWDLPCTSRGQLSSPALPQIPS